MGTRAMQPPMGLYFEEFAIGDGCESVGRTVTEADIVNFAALSGDWNRIHTDAHYSQEQMFGERVAHGLLVLSIASGLAVRMGFMEGTVQAFMQLDWQFRRPVLIGTRCGCGRRCARRSRCGAWAAGWSPSRWRC